MKELEILAQAQRIAKDMIDKANERTDKANRRIFYISLFNVLIFFFTVVYIINSINNSDVTTQTISYLDSSPIIDSDVRNIN
jgi:hypothetical protein